MKAKPRSMHVAKISRTVKGVTYTTWLLRRTYREDGKVKHETLANLSALPEHAILALQKSLKGDPLVSPEDLFDVVRTLPHGHVEAVLLTISRLGLPRMFGSNDVRKRQIVLALIAQRILAPSSKLASARLWLGTTLAEEFGVADASMDEIYEAMDWLLGKQKGLENQLAKRHLQEGGLVLYDVTSSYYEGSTCSLARHGHDRDGKKGLPIIVYGLLTNGDGCPVAVEVYPGNTGDPSTVPDQVSKLRDRFGIDRVVLAGDRGMLTDAQIETLKSHPEMGWISALRHNHLLKLVHEGKLERTLFDLENLAEITSPEFPGERLIACFNLALGEKRAKKREELLKQTEARLEKLKTEVDGRTKKPLTADQIGMKAGKWLDKWKMKKHFIWEIKDGHFIWSRDEESIRQEAALDGIYVIRTSEKVEDLSAADAVRNYKRLTKVEAAFRTLKGTDLKVRPIHHRIDDRVRAHIFLCMLAYYVEWHMRKALAPLLFADEHLDEAWKDRDPVKPAEISNSAKRKKSTGKTEAGLAVQSFRTLLEQLATRSKATVRAKGKEPEFSYPQLTELTPLQKEAFRLLEGVPTY